jgi:selenide,water dikinase
MAQHILPDAAYKNWQAYSAHLIGEPAQIEAAFMLLSDPQSSGGLLVACSEDSVEELQAMASTQNAPYPLTVIGKVTESGKVEIT